MLCFIIDSCFVLVGVEKVEMLVVVFMYVNEIRIELGFEG